MIIKKYLFGHLGCLSNSLIYVCDAVWLFANLKGSKDLEKAVFLKIPTD